MSRSDVIVSGRGAAQQPAPLQTIARPVAALPDHTVQAGAVLNPAAEFIDPADGSATRLRSARERRPAAVAAGSGARVDEDSSERLTHPYLSQRLRVDQFPRTRMEVAILKRPVGYGLEPTDYLVNSCLTDRNQRRPDRPQPVKINLTRYYTQGRLLRSRSPQQPPDVTSEIEALATVPRRLS